MAMVMGFVLCLAEARRLPGQNEGFPWIPGLMIRRNTTPHVQFRGPREFMVKFRYSRLFGHPEHQFNFFSHQIGGARSKDHEPCFQFRLWTAHGTWDQNLTSLRPFEVSLRFFVILNFRGFYRFCGISRRHGPNKGFPWIPGLDWTSCGWN